MKLYMNLFFHNLWVVWIIHTLSLIIKIPVSIIVHFLWKPNLSTTTTSEILNDDISNYDFDSTKKFMEDNKYLENYDDSELAEDGDNPKFYGMLDHAVGDKTDKYFNKLMSYIDENGVMGRYAPGHPKRDSAPNISGDMMSGINLSITNRLIARSIPNEYKEKLRKFFELTIFIKPVQTFSDPEEGKYSNQGTIYTPLYESTPGLCKLLSYLYLGYKVTGEDRYHFWYKMFYYVSYPLLKLKFSDANIFYDNFYVIKWHTPHSRFLNYTTLYMLTKNKIYKDLAENTYKRYGYWNLDMKAIWFSVFENEMTDEEMKTFCQMLISTVYKGVGEVPSEKLDTYYSGTRFIEWVFPKIKFLLKISKEDPGTWGEPMSNHFLSPKYLGQRYLWEKTPIKGYTASDQRRKMWIIDSLIPWYGYLRHKK